MLKIIARLYVKKAKCIPYFPFSPVLHVLINREKQLNPSLIVQKYFDVFVTNTN